MTALLFAVGGQVGVMDRVVFNGEIVIAGVMIQQEQEMKRSRGGRSNYPWAWRTHVILGVTACGQCPGYIRSRICTGKDSLIATTLRYALRVNAKSGWRIQ